MSDEQRYNVTIGLSIVKGDAPAFADFGLRYSGMKYADVVQVEAAMAKYAEGINKAMEPLIAELVSMGYGKAEERSKQSTSQSQGVMR